MEDITAILTLYKRPQYLEEQLIAIQNQTIPPKEIFILKNTVENINFPNISSNLLKNVTIINSSKNFGVWGRFALGLLANTKYICVFDDDTIPGKKWFENCLNSMNIKEGLYGTVGLIFQNDCYESNIRFGWPNPNNNIQQVDIVGHNWFLKREWLHYLWEYSPNYNINLKYGEDISLSFYLQKHNIPTLVPPHPHGEEDYYGSIPYKAAQYGGDVNATSLLVEVNTQFNIFLGYCINKGFKLLYRN
jgi:hypothetical protein